MSRRSATGRRRRCRLFAAIREWPQVSSGAGLRQGNWERRPILRPACAGDARLPNPAREVYGSARSCMSPGQAVLPGAPDITTSKQAANNSARDLPCARSTNGLSWDATHLSGTSQTAHSVGNRDASGWCGRSWQRRTRTNPGGTCLPPPGRVGNCARGNHFDHLRGRCHLPSQDNESHGYDLDHIHWAYSPRTGCTPITQATNVRVWQNREEQKPMTFRSLSRA
jgi:hypothetical protein